jgi:hypothetical protein
MAKGKWQISNGLQFAICGDHMRFGLYHLPFELVLLLCPQDK